MARVTVEDCVDKIPNRFELVMMASQRARGISAGAQLTVERDNDKNPVVSLREIAEEMTKRGHKMNHASARNYFIRAMKKLASSVQVVNPDIDTDTIATNPLFQSSVADFLREKNGPNL